ncbi:MAG TPA: phosphate acyltransferase PlsX [Anaerolineales bacterium]|nr:phosphate acyltransferase PlsX [Anaerolineales bacterium]HMV98223.1 phosphate acyltransferase PlsX [Anaerolineales bacterium]HMX18023.1 phosphate acyltransferase PlsX [Anaerolineales bacterium]HMX73408.1 phosphate acyltransferase PlsX [Anaerolineales bacterium]HMZ42050.1 phosphate acyltransferase PlsX [Anaerolineales bacterium]
MARIVVDAMGSDSYPVPDVEGAVMAAREYGAEIILVGDEARIKPVLATQNTEGLKIRIVNTPEMLTMEDKGENLVLKARAKDAKTSMAVGIDLVKNGEADAFVTAGNTGAGMVTALFRLGRIRGVDRPALAPIFPTATGTCVVLDIGANPDCKAENLYQFGILGSIYAEKVRGVKSPKVGLVSNGEEEGKGNELVKAATPLFKASKLNYFGNVEGKEVIGGKVDVAVTDGFTGNVMLKSSEAVAKLITDKIREIIKNGSILTKIGGMLVRPALGAIKKLLDPSEQGAAPLLGVNGLVFIGHGRSDAIAIKNAVRVAKHAVDVKVLDAMKSAIEESLKS